uniref:Uncharacterized protein n=1 Tax=Clytia hemisphaerica TaxID=252671 RepID=A0A7M5XD43_9CNID
MFRFFMLLFHYDELPRHDEKDPLINLDLRYKFDEKDKFGGKKKVDVSNFRRVTSLGAALPFIIQKPGCMMGSQSTESLDIVLSFHLNGYWPDCASEWKEKYKTKLAKEAYDLIIQCGVSTVCKTPPVQKADTVKNLPLMFRLSFSRAETKLMNLVTPEQKEAYKCLKMLRETELNDYRFFGLRLGGFLKKKFTSYHLKSLFLTLTTGNDEEKSASEWFVVLLNEVLRGLANREIRHHFISGVNLLENASIEEDLQREFRINWFQRDLPFYDPPMLRIDFEKTIEVSKEWFRRYKSKLVPSEYLAVYDTDQCELDTCMVLRKVFEDALHNLDSSRFQELQQKCLYQNSYDCLGFSE